MVVDSCDVIGDPALSAAPESKVLKLLSPGELFIYTLPDLVLDLLSQSLSVRQGFHVHLALSHWRETAGH